MKTLAAIDIGTNSIRLVVVRVEEGFALTTLTQQKETVRLGEGEFARNRMTADAIGRGALVCARFCDVARGFGAEEIICLATSAVREAENQHEFIEKVRNEAGLEVRVISGVEEARLIYLGVSSGIDLGVRNALFIDIGGGSTELVLANGTDYFMLDSLKLGSIRLSSRFLAGITGRITDQIYDQLVHYVRGVASHVTRRIRERGFEVVYGSGGTITNMASVTAHRLGGTTMPNRNYEMSLEDLQETVSILRNASLEERRKVAGLDPDRADIIIGGAAVIMTLLADAGAKSIVVSDRGLRDGIIVDRLLREEEGRKAYESLSVRRRSILQLARSCKFEEDHAHHVLALCGMLFDELHELGFHPYGEVEKELLEYASIVHDIGCFLSHTNHHIHAYYLIRHSDLLGFNDDELDIIANVAMYHRKAIPRKKHPNLSNQTRAGVRLIRVLASILRVAEGLDRSHLSLVKSVRLTPARNPERLIMTISSEADCQLELWGVESNRDLFEHTFGFPLVTHVEPITPLPIKETLAAVG